MIGLFDEAPDPIGNSGSRHTYLLWALERLTWSPQHFSRAVLALARLAEVDPGGRLANRPSASLLEALHLVFPHSAVTARSRLEVLDMLRERTPDVAWELELSLLNVDHRTMMIQQGPVYRDWPIGRTPTSAAAVCASLIAIATRAASDAGTEGSRWTALSGFLDRLPPAARDAVITSAEDVWPNLLRDDQARVVRALTKLLDRHREFSGAAWALDEESLKPIRAFVAAHDTASSHQDQEERALFDQWPHIGGLDIGTAEGNAAVEDARRAVVERLLSKGLSHVLELAEHVEVAECVGVALADVAPQLKGQLIPLLEEGNPSTRRKVAHGYAARSTDANRGWLEEALQAHPALATDLLLVARVDSHLLRLLETQPLSVQEEYWRRIQPWSVADTLVDEVAQSLVNADRPYSAIRLLARRRSGDRISVAAALGALRAVATTSESPHSVLSVGYSIGEVLDRLGEEGVDRNELATLEWYFDPLLHDERVPTVLHEMLAQTPILFADLVTAMYKSDGDEEDRLDPHEVESRARLAEASWRVLHSWRSPLPGQRPGEPPTAEGIKAWIDAARANLAERRRARVASLAIGEVLSGPYTDEDGLWPCRAVRDVLEVERDSDLEGALAIGRLNQRGVTTRGLYEGGTQERKLADQYRGWADRVRLAWPRAGALLDGLARSYESDARLEDRQADRQADR